MPFIRPVPEAKFCSKEVGERTEAIIIARLMECGYIVCIPFGNSQRYDLVIEDNDCRFWRIQCKTGRYRGGTIVFDTSRVLNEYTRNWERKGYEGEVDFFAVYSKDFGKVYLVPIDEFGHHRRGFLRIDQPNRGVLPSTRWAADFEL